MDLSQWFTDQLDSGAQGFIWAVEQVPPERRLLTPPKPLGEWNAARHVFHMLYYEQNAVLPGMKIWLDQPFTLNEADYNEAAAWGDGKDLESILTDFRRVRAEQLEVLAHFNDQLWHETRQTLWGEVTLLWIVSKTFQHTAEHTNDVMRMALFWDAYAGQEKEP
ncbi:MAG: hypothetical protein NVS3B14_06850 [Ktedonobacteraceae bacterium]